MIDFWEEIIAKKSKTAAEITKIKNENNVVYIYKDCKKIINKKWFFKNTHEFYFFVVFRMVDNCRFEIMFDNQEKRDEFFELHKKILLEKLG